MTRITVSIVTYRTDLTELAACLDSLTSPSVGRIYVVDNSSMDEIGSFCKRYPKVEYMASGNVGYGSGHNKALRRAMEGGSDFHLVLNSDVYFEPDVLDRIAGYMTANRDVAQVQPRIVYPDGREQYTCRLLPTPLNLIFRRFMPRGWGEKMDRRYRLEFAPRDREMNVPYHQGSFIFFRTECFRKTGLFDERFFMYPEDIDISRRMHRYFRTMYWPEVTVVHAHRAASYKSWRMLGIHMANMVRYFNKWGWVSDRERTEYNATLLSELGYDKNA